ncbi:hypothetical protein C2845_PM02G18860 [Panicum miliaceum]|uniref:Uncharacterized protein n=2 Tax=Panicum sect. Panicum TaxID=2100772 RepID=A0A3L6S4I4_PANMI|nr:hypothetical protein C2845_PM02G18860 [Panicum miliaceum]
MGNDGGDGGGRTGGCTHLLVLGWWPIRAMGFYPAVIFREQCTSVLLVRWILGYKQKYRNAEWKGLDVFNSVIIGKSGETIMYLQFQSGAKIEVTRDN